MMCYPNVPFDDMRLKFIPFALKDVIKSGCIACLQTPLLIGKGLRMSSYENSSLIVKLLS